MMLRSRGLLRRALALSAVLTSANAYRVAISDTDELREVCSGMYGGKEAHIEVAFDSSSNGQVALVIYEWSDVPYLGIATPDNTVGGVERPKTYICTSSAVRNNLCTADQLGRFITHFPESYGTGKSSIYTTALHFATGGAHAPPATTPPMEDGPGNGGSNDGVQEGQDELGDEDEEDLDGDLDGDAAAAVAATAVEAGIARNMRSEMGRKILRELSPRYKNASDPSSNPISHAGASTSGPQTYDGAIRYEVDKTGYYCVGIVPVTLVSARSESDDLNPRGMAFERQATHAEYSGEVLFRNTFEGELPAVEYPKINLYLALSLVYLILGGAWAFLCVRHFSELLPMQYYISGTILFLLIEMIAQFAYYRYINKHGGGTTSIVFLFVIAILNAARNSLSFFLLLIVAMGLSVVTQSLGGVMTRIRVLTGFHFVFGVMYAVGTVEVQLDSANLLLVLLLIFPLSFTLTLFLMWIIISLNGTILHLAQRKQRSKLQMFQRLWRILVVSVIAVFAFFVVSTMSLSNRLDEDYAPKNWRWRWILLDGSLAGIYLGAFAAIAWLWRPTRDNVRFAMSQELAQDEGEADAEDYEIDSLERGTGTHQRLGTGDEDDEDEDHAGIKRSGVGNVREENVVFQMGEDSDDEEDARGASGGGGPPRYSDTDADADGRGSRGANSGRRRKGSDGSFQSDGGTSQHEREFSRGSDDEREGLAGNRI